MILGRQNGTTEQDGIWEGLELRNTNEKKMIKIWFLKIISGKKKTYSETHKVHIKGKSCVAISLRWIRKQNFFFFWYLVLCFGFLVSLRDAKM